MIGYNPLNDPLFGYYFRGTCARLALYRYLDTHIVGYTKTSSSCSMLQLQQNLGIGLRREAVECKFASRWRCQPTNLNGMKVWVDLLPLSELRNEAAGFSCSVSGFFHLFEFGREL